MLVELHTKGGTLCSQAKQGTIRCPLLVRPTSEDVVTGQIVQTLKLIDPRHWLHELLNRGLGTRRFKPQVYRNFRIEPWIGKPPFPRELIKWDEGSTEVDVQITWENPATTVFVEAKYGSKLSKSTSNNNGQHGYPADQLLRNIRVGLHECGYYKTPRLFEAPKRDFVVLVLSPERGQPLVTSYRDEANLRAGIPHSEKIEQFPAAPFVGELGYADILNKKGDRHLFHCHLFHNSTETTPYPSLRPRNHVRRPLKGANHLRNAPERPRSRHYQRSHSNIDSSGRMKWFWGGVHTSARHNKCAQNDDPQGR